MSGTNLFIASDHASIVANDLRDLRYHATALYLPPGAQVPVRDSADAETVFFVDRGTLEFMVNGATTLVAEGAFVRVPRHTVFAYRNAGHDVARILGRVERPQERLHLVRVTLEYAA